MQIKRFRLRTLMLLLTVGGILLTSVLLLGALTFFQRGNIENSLLKGNIAYARKLADTTDLYLSTAQKELSYSASIIKDFRSQQLLQTEANRLRLQSDFFNSVVIVTANAVVAATSPESLNLVGLELHSAASQRAISIRKPFISQPFTSATGNYVVFLSHPIFSKDGVYIGYLGGTIYLKKRSILSNILGQHFYGNKANISIVTNKGRIIYSRDPSMIGSSIKTDARYEKIFTEAGNGHYVEGQGKGSNLIGYANLRQADWKIFISGTSENVSNILKETISSTVWFVMVIIVLTVGIVIFFSARISRPLEKLASLTRSANSDSTLKELSLLSPGYLEAELLKEAVSHHLIITNKQVNMLSDEAMTDPLTGLYNRKGFKIRTKAYDYSDNHSLIAIDIDYFKRVNDDYGHDTGDAILVETGKLLRIISRQNDIVSRFGGEEFIIFLPDCHLEEAVLVATRIRMLIEEHLFPNSIHITLSAGVATLTDCEKDINLLMRQADLAMYEAKKAGRNCVCLSQSGTFSIPLNQ